MKGSQWLGISKCVLLTCAIMLGSSCREKHVDSEQALTADVAASRWSGIVFGIPMQAQFYGLDASEAEQLHAAIERTAREYETSFSLYSDRSELSQLNASRVLSQPSALMLRLSARAQHLHAMSGGYFDPAIQALWDALDVADTEQVIQRWHVPAAYSHVLIQESAIELVEPRVKLSFNALVQGDFADAVAAIARGMGVESALLELGETVAIGQHPEGRAWALAVRSAEGGELLGVVELSDRGLAISSQSIESPGFDPLAGTTVTRELTVAVESQAGAAVADAFATAFLAAPEEQWESLYIALKSYGMARVHVWGEDGMLASYVEEELFDRKQLPPCCQ
ncbi:FAD:protein FMN transferase [Rubritalea marina]|uniref:FAD:protein FMN transferase n=1 Tax=Rubritalea marina TaxID=361055 RepID=UPI000371B882|nr:FAD:protein FMN transferase [Rubritalea marina]